MKYLKQRKQQSSCLKLIVADISVSGDTTVTHSPGVNGKIFLSLRPTVYNVYGTAHYDWSASEGVDNGEHTDEVYTLRVIGSNEKKDVIVTCKVTDDSGSTSTLSKTISLEYKEV